MPLDFKQIDIHQFLFAALPVRFQDTDPKDFEDFVGYLFLENGYALEQTSYSADFGADLIVERDGIRTAVQVKRFHASHKVGVQEVNQVIGAEQYYTCTNSMVITASSFTRAAHDIAAAAEVLLWDWERLEQAIRDTFLEGLDYYEYYRQNPVQINEAGEDLKFTISEIDIGDEATANTLIRGEIENQSDENIQVYCDLPVYITHERKQFSAVEWTDESFTNGVIYTTASVEVSCLFSKRHLAEVHKRDRIILTIHQVGRNESIHLEYNLGTKRKACFFVTYCFGRHSKAYSDMIAFRDQVLEQSAVGRRLVQAYYRKAPRLILHLEKMPGSPFLIRPLLWIIVSVCRIIHGIYRLSDLSDFR
ncbi:MAG: restriction endonuclease [Saprospiraceae bacterium]|nr:restriction endonuclease [Saprospiraceae bacterium]